MKSSNSQRQGKPVADQDLEELVEAARRARESAYAPYSHYSVGAAVMAKTGSIYSGCNIENAAYPSSMCAERVAVYKAISSGEQQITAMAVATENEGSPCGACRQVLSEFADDDVIIVLAAAKGSHRKKFTMREILPDRFGPEKLK